MNPYWWLTLGAVGTLFTGLAGAWFGHHTSTLRAFREYRLQKLEELWRLNKMMLHHHRRHYESFTKDGLGNTKEEQAGFMEKMLVHATETQMIASLYFPELLPSMERVDNAWQIPANFDAEKDGPLAQFVRKHVSQSFSAAIQAQHDLEKDIVYVSKRVRSESLWLPEIANEKLRGIRLDLHQQHRD